MRVLLAHDGSAGADLAAALTASIPWPAGTRVRILGVVDTIRLAIAGPWAPGFGAGPWAPAFGAAPSLSTAIAEYLDRSIAAAVSGLATAHLSVEGAVLHGRPASVIIDQARDFDADLVIVGSRGHGAIASLLLGSVSTEISDEAACPVFVARATTMRRVVLATDGSPSSRAAEAIVADWPIFTGPTIHVVSVADATVPWTVGIAPMADSQPPGGWDVAGTYDAELTAATEAHQRIVDEAAARLRAAGRVVEAGTRTGDAASEIVDLATHVQADLIVVGSRGRSGLTRLLLGSVARNVLSGSSASVLIVRDGGQLAGDVPMSTLVTRDHTPGDARSRTR